MTHQVGFLDRVGEICFDGGVGGKLDERDLAWGSFVGQGDFAVFVDIGEDFNTVSTVHELLVNIMSY